MRARLPLALLLLAGCRADAPGPAADAPAPGVVAADSLARHPTVAVDADGVALVAWTASVDTTTDVYLARVVGGAAGPAVRVNHRRGDAATHAQAPAQVAAGPDGSVYVGWIATRAVPGRRFPASDLRLARSDDGGRTFAPAVTVNDDGGFRSSHHFHDVAVGPDGTVFVSWLDGRANDRVRAAHRAAEAPAAGRGAGGGHGGGAHDGPTGAPGTEVRVARSTDGGRTFGPSVVVASGTCECCRTRLALGPDGAVYVAWRHQFGPDVRDVAVARSDDGGRTFGAPARVHADGWRLDGCPHAGPSLAVDTAGRVHVAWYTGAEGRAGLYHAVSADRGATFGPAATVAAGARIAPTALTSDGAGGVWLAWESGADSTRVAHLAAGRPFDVRGAAVAGGVPSLAAAARPVLVRVEGGRVVATAVPLRP